MMFSSVTGKDWNLKTFDSNQAIKIKEKFFLDETVSKLLSIRKIVDIKSFLNPTIKNYMPNPFNILDMDIAVDRVIKSIINNEKIGIFGDYDVDGATSTALLVNYFKKIKSETFTYIPDRRNEGYGPSINGFKTLITKGVKIIITVDCGTSSFEPIKYSQESFVDVIVLDHHQSEVKLPIAKAVVNPNRIDDTSNLNYLCAAGVSLMFLVALNKKLRDLSWFDKNNIQEPKIINFLDLVCLGTVCDVVPLIGLNRAIVSQGLKVIKKRNNLGLKTLYDICNIQSQPTTYHLGFLLGPRINAGGRVGKASHGSDLFISDNPQKIYKIAKELDDYNLKRQKIEKDLLLLVDLQAQNNLKNSVLVLHSDDWHEGIIGIIASRIKEKYGKPTFLITFNGDKGKGSARSIFGFDIGSAIISAVDLGFLEKGGGHKMAGGFSIKKNQLNNLKKFLEIRFNKVMKNYSKSKNISFDDIISPTALNEDFYNKIYQLSPFGPGNSEPKFVIENLKVVKSILIANNHIKTFFLAKNGKTFCGLSFNSMGTKLEGYLSKGSKKKIRILGKLSLNEWKGKKSIEFIIDDLSVH